MRSHVNRWYCRSCGHVVRLSRSYAFTPVGECEPRFRTIREWDAWQARAFESSLRAAPAGEPIFSDGGVMLLRGYRMNPLRRIRTGVMILYPDRIELATLLGERLAFPVADIEGAGVLKQQLFEFYIGKTLYQFRFPRRFQSARKWYDAVSVLKRLAAAPSDGGAATAG